MSSQTALLRRLAWNVLPASVVVGAVWFALAGEEGLLRRHELKQQLLAIQTHHEQVQQDNAELRRHIRALRTEVRAVERTAATQLLLAQPGSTVYRFDGERRD
jgi:cell division protein FtsB